jgi:hypothetical protein
MARAVKVICGVSKRKYFCDQGWTMIRFNKFRRAHKAESAGQ